jgi:phosphoenolpyruvate synthase/pyruvate phosphate dikinase
MENIDIVPPPLIFGIFDKSVYYKNPEPVSTDEMHGLSVSPGVATGRARVLLRSGGDNVLEKGEILIAPYTDPGWTPYFIPAAGIVMDMGGLLSHGSIIAREYGIPAVVNVGHATRIIRSGQMVTVDGNRGVVKIH